MPDYTLRWANRSANSVQDWQIDNGDAFQLAPNFVRNVAITVNNDHIWQIVVTADVPPPLLPIATADLIYIAAADTWVLNSNTPNEWQLATGNGIVTVRCLL